MGEQAPPEGNLPMDSDSDLAYQILLRGIDQGFDNVILKLSEVSSQLDTIPTRISDILSSHPVGPEPINGTHESNLPVGDLKSHNQLLQTENQDLSNEIMKLKTRLQTETAEVQRLTQIDANSKSELAHLKAKEVALREMIVGKAGAQKITDPEVVTAFSVMRQQVQALGRNSTYQLERKHLTLSPKISPRMKAFYGLWHQGHLSPKDLALRMRAEIFTLLYDRILNINCFGLHVGGNMDERYKGFNEVERQLRRFEEILEKVNSNLTAEWRISTLDGIQNLKIPDELCRDVAEEIDDHLSPLLHSKANRKEQDELFQKILEVCQQAYKLRMMMRKSKERYYCYLPNSKDSSHLSKIKQFADSFDVEGGKAEDESDEVAYVLFGALMKDTRNLGGEVKVLEKASVILKRKSQF